MLTVFEGSDLPGIKRVTLNATATNVSPLAVALPAIPAYGRYLAAVTAWFGNNGDRGYAWFLIDYYKAATSNATLLINQIGTSGFTPGQQMTGLTLAGVASTGVLTATITSTRGNSQGDVQVDLFELSGLQSQFTV